MWPWNSLLDSRLARLAGLRRNANDSRADVLAGHTPVISFGVCTDLQWADVDDRVVRNQGAGSRFYRRALKLAETAANDFQSRSAAFAIHLGDIVDQCQQSTHAKHGTMRDALNYALDQALAAFGQFTAGTTYHVIGNHCLYSYSRRRLRDSLGMMGPGDRCYYSFVPHSSLRMLVLDTFDVALIGNEPDSAEAAEARDLLHQHQAQEPLEPTDVRRRWQHFNGAVGKAQLRWMREELAAAAELQQRAVICSHCPIHPRSAGARTKSLLWNYEDVLAVIAEAGNVLATLSGHIHQQGHHVDERGVHFITLPALLEAPPQHSTCHAFMHVLEDGFVLEGCGEVVSIDGRPAARPEA
eukprot:jgi/Ulvmu1/2195/UM013_0041.1